MLRLKIYIAHLFILFSCVAGAQSGLSIDAQPFLLYSGNIIAPGSSGPTFIGSEGLKRGIDYSRYRTEKDDWIRYRLAMRYHRNTQKELVELHDEFLMPTGITDKELNRQSDLQLSLSIEEEKWHGEHKVKGVFGRGITVETTRRLSERTVVNPLEMHLGDTLWMDSGFSFAFMATIHTGLAYPIADDLSVSGRIAWGARVNYRPERHIRVVLQENTGAEIVQFVQSPSRSTWGLDIVSRPNITLTYYFR